MKETVVLHAGIGVGHLVPMVELAKLFVRHDFSITILSVDPPNKAGSTSHVISRLSAANPSISFHVLPPISLPPSVENDHLNLMRAVLNRTNSILLDFLSSLSKTTSIHAIMLDIFCTEALDVASQLGIPAYFFMASGASALAAILHLPVLDTTTTVSFKDMGKTPIHFPGLPPIAASDLPETVADRNSESYKCRMVAYPRLIEAKGILINSFEWLETKAVKAMRDGLCFPGRTMPPVCCIGPLVSGGEEKKTKERHECLIWLDSQPKGSVVFLCFGSMGSFTMQQIKEIAIGLENSGQRFLWVVQGPLTDPSKLFEPRPEPELDILLPEGFLDRTKDRGTVVKSWAPQVEVLNHESVGWFVSHCGWNSSLEAIRAGVPMICWPLYAEQRMNKVFLVEEMKIAVVMKGYDEELVPAEEVESKLRWLMESEGGKVLKENMAVVKEKSMEALGEAGPSSQAFKAFLKDLRSQYE